MSNTHAATAVFFLGFLFALAVSPLPAAASSGSSDPPPADGAQRSHLEECYLAQADPADGTLHFEEEELDSSQYYQAEDLDQAGESIEGEVDPAEMVEQEDEPYDEIDPYWFGEAPTTPSPEQETVTVGQRVSPPQRIIAAARGGYGRFTETTIDQSAEVLSVGLEFQWYPKSWLGLVVPFLADSYQRRYQALGTEGATGLPGVQEEEWRFDTGAAVAFDVLEKAGYGAGWLYIGGRYFTFFNDSFNQHAAGVVTGAHFDLPITGDLSGLLFGDYTYNLLSLMEESEEGLRSITGRPIASLRFGAGLALAIGSTSSLAIVYRGEHIPHDHTDLFVHRALLETAVSFEF
ncbi:MAG: hypothetical protein JW797_13720 [Bradymonadales bacterium]|nr:hypothetical protein [Bradymonadales bacterium]